MADLYVLASIPDQGKTTSALLLEKKLRDEGKRVACLQNNKGINDVYRYLSEGCYHYSIPLEATQTREAFEKWVPQGYDAYIMEITMPYSPFGAAYVDLFQNVNEVISIEYLDTWKEYIMESYAKLWGRSRHGVGQNQDLMVFWDLIHNRNTRRLITKTPSVIDGPCVDTVPALHHMDELLVEKIQPQMVLPKGSKKVIAVGIFPAEYWDIFPSLNWFRLNYAEFMEEIRKKQYDLAIIGGCGAKSLKLQNPSQDHPQIICHQPSVFLNLKKRQLVKPLSGTYPSIHETIKKEKAGTRICADDEPYCGYNNRYWVHQIYDVPEPVWKSGNTIFCDGWVLPQYLIRDGYLEVN